MQPKELILVELNGELQQKILDSLKTEYFLTGKFAKDQICISPKIMSALMIGFSFAD